MNASAAATLRTARHRIPPPRPGRVGLGLALVIALAVAFWPESARLARSYVAASRRRPDVLAARAAGIGWPRAAAGHLVPGAASQLMIVGALDISQTITAIVGLSFLGLGVQPPTAEWGAMLADSSPYLTTAPWLLAAPAAAMMLSLLAANLIGEGLHAAGRVGDPR